jgi:hypothetical protein
MGEQDYGNLQMIPPLKKIKISPLQKKAAALSSKIPIFRQDNCYCPVFYR